MKFRRLGFPFFVGGIPFVWNFPSYSGVKVDGGWAGVIFGVFSWNGKDFGRVAMERAGSVKGYGREWDGIGVMSVW